MWFHIQVEINSHRKMSKLMVPNNWYFHTNATTDKTQNQLRADRVRIEAIISAESFLLALQAIRREFEFR